MYSLQSSFNPTYVRRRMKLVLRQQRNRLRMRMVRLHAPQPCGHAVSVSGKLSGVLHLFPCVAGDLEPDLRTPDSAAADAGTQPAAVLRGL